MLTTNSSQALNFHYDSTRDSTVFLNPGTAQVGSYILDFPGGYKTFSEMTDFTSSGVYQYSVLCMQNVNNFPDMTTVTFTPVDSVNKLISPYISDSSTLRPLGLFLFYTDGTDITLTSSSRIQ